MKQITINIPETKFQFFIELTKQLGLEISQEKTVDFIVPEWQKELVRERIKNSKPEDYVSWETLEKQLKLSGE
jgi:hypothetical protein